MAKLNSNKVQPQSHFYKEAINYRRNVSQTKKTSPSVGLAGWSLLIAV